MPETGPFAWHELRVPDLAEAERFYGAAFGWAFTDNPMGRSITHRGVVIGGASGVKVGLDTHWTPNVACADVDAAAARAAAAGGIVTTGQPADVPGIGRIAPILDPDKSIFVAFAPPAGGPRRPTGRAGSGGNASARRTARRGRVLGRHVLRRSPSTPIGEAGLTRSHPLRSDVMADQAHAVSDADLDATHRLLAATPGLVGEPSDAERSRTLVAMATHATLATVATDRVEGYPFGSLVACAADGAGRVVLCLSDLAVHAVNLAADPRASVLVAARASGDPLAAARVTLVGDLREVPSAEGAAARDEYRRVHVDAFYAGFADFRVYRLEPTAVRYVGGFGRMSWVSATAYRGAAPDPLRSQAQGILEHMNDDHADALLAFCRVLGGRAEVTAARMVGVDRYGFDVLASAPEATPRAMRFGFDAPVDTPDAVRMAMIDLVRRTR